MKRMFLLLLSSALLAICAAQCNSGWTRHEDSCYLYFHEPYTFFEAKLACDIAQAHMVEIESASENNFVKNLGGASPPGRIWMGMEDFLEEGNYQWTSSLAVPVFTNWAPGDPNNYHDAEDCVALLTDLPGHWVDLPCEDKYPFVCETMFDGEAIVG